MSTFDAVSRYFSGQGVVMIGQRDSVTGLSTGLRPLGNVPDLKITIGTTVLDHKGSQDGQRATDVRLQTETKVMASVTLESWNAANLAKALRGDVTMIAPGVSTNEGLVVYPGMVTPLRYIKVTNFVLKQGATNLVVFTQAGVAWDYKLNAAAGSIMLNDGTVEDWSEYLEGSPIDIDGMALTATYNYAVQELVNSLTSPLNDSWLRFEGLNTIEDNAPVIIDIFRFSNDPLKELAMISDTIGQMTLEGSVLKDDFRLTGSKYFSIKKI